MIPTTKCPALMIASPSSGQGKTTFTAMLARAYTKKGLKVAIFKMGPDYLDPMIHEVACGQAVYNLDLWMMGEQHCKELLFNAAHQNDLILIESLMGLYDNEPSSAEFAELFIIPVVLLMNVAKYAQTAAAIVHGLQYYPSPLAKPLNLYGVVGNRVASDNHHRILQETLGQQYLGSVRRDDKYQIPHRHLGLIQAQELTSLNSQLNDAASKLADDGFISEKLLQQPPGVAFVRPERKKTTQHYINKTIAIARDTAFSFIYPANIDYLKNNGANIKYFSPLKNELVPAADMLWLPGGYPELHLALLTENEKTKQSIRAFCQSEKPVLAECGGFIYLLDSITDKHANSGIMCGVIPGTAKLEKHFQGIGLQSVEINNNKYFGHSFHHSIITTPLQATCHTHMQNGEQAEAIYRYKNITASYMHFYFSISEESLWCFTGTP